ncbi:uncharacterized protein LOC128553058 isoform X2 [Mercenaria mercenaria]|uniref:uncharacterized protein LOC128553058 isoform X1 n=1 Tax=Mercenaria mercenaria TaxID=6596 RepID=UPI00234F6342|nr:uncharacterized protein LOC128553058 isoform X1 [Mercenaria mercenaria]XP_053390146.1 uncharacterized protein LOC128553058 isoform X2 [Mercenaria mercenaria]
MEDEDRNNTHSENAVNNLVTENSGTDTDAVTQTNNQVAQISDDPPPYDEIYNLHWRKGALESNLKIILPGGKSTTHDKVSYVLPNKENSVPGNVIQSDESTEDIFESRFQALEQTVTETRQVAGETHSLQQSICERMASIEQHIRERQVFLELYNIKKIARKCTVIFQHFHLLISKFILIACCFSQRKKG